MSDPDGPVAFSAGWYWQTDSRYRLVHLFGSPAGWDALGRRLWEFPGVDTHHPDWAAQFDAMMARRAFQNLLWRRVDASGRLRQCVVSGEPLFGPKGRFLGFRGIGHDAGEALEAQRCLVRDLRETLATLGAQAALARTHVAVSSPARAFIDEIEQGAQRARVMCGLVHEMVLPAVDATQATAPAATVAGGSASPSAGIGSTLS